MKKIIEKVFKKTVKLINYPRNAAGLFKQINELAFCCNKIIAV